MARLIVALAFFMTALSGIGADFSGLFTGDLDGIKERGELRVLATATPELDGLQRRLSPRDFDRVFLSDLAEDMGVILKYVYVDTFPELIPALLEGRGDIIADNISVTKERKELVAFTRALSVTQDQIVAAKSNKKVRAMKDLAGKSVHYEAGTTYEGALGRLREKVPSLLAVPEDSCDTESLLYRVASGAVELSIADSSYVHGYLCYRNNIKVVHTLPEKSVTAWAVRKGSPELLKALNNYLAVSLHKYKDHLLKGDLAEIQKRKFIRILTRNNPACYYIYKGRLAGFEYELARKFAEERKVYPIMIVPPNWDDLIPWLEAGKGDIVAAHATSTKERRAMPGIAMCEPYCEGQIRLVGRSFEDPVSSLADLAGRTIFARENSSYWELLSRMKTAGASFNLMPAPQRLETFEIIDMVAKGEYDLTVADEHISRMECSRRDDAKELARLGGRASCHWLVRAEDVHLKAAVDEFFQRERGTAFFNYVSKLYFGGLAKGAPSFPDPGNVAVRVSSYDNIIKKYAAKYGFHWLLICSQIYQESCFDHSRESSVGSVGLMQVMPATADEMGVGDFRNPDANVHAGVKYLHTMRSRLSGNMPDSEKHMFLLAAYNAGMGHVLDAQRLATQMNLDPNRWFNNVEKTIRLLAREEYASRAKYGYCRGDEPANYVRMIILRYRAYQQEEAARRAKENAKKIDSKP